MALVKVQQVGNSNHARKITKGAFRRRLTLSEKVSIKTSVDPIVAVLSEDLTASAFVNLDFDQFVSGLSYLVKIGILTTERKAELLRDGIPSEAY